MLDEGLSSEDDPTMAYRASRRGFTLVELLCAVAMVGILSTLGIYSLRSYLHAAHSGEAKSMIQSIRAGEEGLKSETLAHRGCGTDLTSRYPRQVPDSHKASWINSGHPDAACWSTLNVVADGPVLYVYSVVAGAAGQAPPATIPNQAAPTPTWPNPTREPWYVVQAVGDLDDDGQYSEFLSSSFGEIHMENETE